MKIQDYNEKILDQIHVHIFQGDFPENYGTQEGEEEREAEVGYRRATNEQLSRGPYGANEQLCRGPYGCQVLSEGALYLL